MSEVKRWRIPKILYPCFAPVSETDEVVPAAAYDALKREYNDLKHNRDGWMRSCNDWRARTKEAEDRIVDLGNRLLKAEAERDSLRMAGVDPRYEAMRQRAEKAEAERDINAKEALVTRSGWESALAREENLKKRITDEVSECDSVRVHLLDAQRDRDKLAATVERVRAVKSRHKHSEYAIALLCELGIALAEPVETRTPGTPGDGSYWHICTICMDVMKDHAHGYGKCAERRGTTGFDARGRRQYDPRSISYTGSDRRRAQRRKNGREDGFMLALARIKGLSGIWLL